MSTWSDLAATGLEMYGTYQQSQAEQDALDDMADTAAGNVAFIAEQGQLGAAEIDAALQNALQYDIGGSSRYIQPYADTGQQAYTQAYADILAGKDTSAYTDAISQGGQSAVSGRQEFQNLGPAMQEAIQKQSGYAGSSYQPGMNQALLGLGRTGQQAAGDIAGIGQRTSQTFGDMERSSALQKASALLGQVAPTLNQMQTGADARLLSDISQSNMYADLLGQGSYYAGSQGWGQ